MGDLEDDGSNNAGTGFRAAVGSTGFNLLSDMKQKIVGRYQEIVQEIPHFLLLDRKECGHFAEG